MGSRILMKNERLTMTYIALLRGINVGPHKVKMDYLRELFGQLGFANVRTFIQTGNVFFDTNETNRPKLEQTISEYLEAQLGYKVPTFLRTVPELEATLAVDGFKGIDLTLDTRFCLVFAATPITPNLELPIRNPKGDMEIVAVAGQEAFVIWRITNGRPPVPGKFLETALGTTTTTTRFLHTAHKLLAAAEQTA